MANQKAGKIIPWQPCDNWNVLFKVEQLKNCARCRAVNYCSKDCQIKGWKAYKPLCLKKDAAADSGHQQAHRAASNLFELIVRHTDEKLFAVVRAEATRKQKRRAAAGTQTQTVIDISSVARSQYRKNGLGILVIEFRDREQCEDLATSLSLAIRGGS
jgi:hypothetical protein